MRQHYHVLALPTTCWPVFLGRIAALTKAENFAETG